MIGKKNEAIFAHNFPCIIFMVAKGTIHSAFSLGTPLGAGEDLRSPGQTIRGCWESQKRQSFLSAGCVKDGAENKMKQERAMA